MANLCRICVNPAWPEKADRWAREGIADREVARRLGIDKSLVTRHRERHIIKPLRNQLAVASKGASLQRERKELAAAAASDAPSPAQFVEAFFGLKAQAEKLQRMAELAEQGGSPNGVASLAAQQLRSVSNS